MTKSEQNGRIVLTADEGKTLLFKPSNLIISNRVILSSKDKEENYEEVDEEEENEVTLVKGKTHVLIKVKPNE